jgi:hypothetical protein
MKSFLFFAAIGSIALLGGCVTAEQTIGPDGRVSYIIDCPGVQHSMSDCYAKAVNLCGAPGYSVVSEETDIHPFAKAPDSGPMVNSSHHALLVACNADTPKDVAAPAPAAPQP